jgi:uncharacterized protein (TIGR01777 family)
MKILISGSHGLLGSALYPALQAAGHDLTRLIRQPGNGIKWNPDTGYIDKQALEDFEAVIHLAAENIGSGLWTAGKQERIKSSRLNGTTLLANTIATLNKPPPVFISASATGYYGDRGSVILDETSTPGEGFLAQVCRDWEKATEPALLAGVRVVQSRFGPILSAQGGILSRLRLPFRFGTGVIMGSGTQYQPWVAIDDAVAALEYILSNSALSGPVNIVAPQAVTNYEFTEVLGQVLRRPARFSLPAALLKLILGNMARELLLSSSRVQPQKLIDSGFKFRFPQLKPALQFILNTQKVKEKALRH